MAKCYAVSVSNRCILKSSELSLCYLSPLFRQASFGFSQDLGQGPELVEGQIAQMYADFLFAFLAPHLIYVSSYQSVNCKIKLYPTTGFRLQLLFILLRCTKGFSCLQDFFA